MGKFLKIQILAAEGFKLFACLPIQRYPIHVKPACIHVLERERKSRPPKRNMLGLFFNVIRFNFANLSFILVIEWLLTADYGSYCPREGTMHAEQENWELGTQSSL